MKNNNKKISISNIISTIFLFICVAVLIVTIVFVISSTGDKFVFGYKPYLISTGSMEPEYRTHGIVIIHKEDYDDIKVNDVVAFEAADLGNQGAMHRVVEITDEGFVTKGDNNGNPDDKLVTKNNYVGKAVWHTNALTGYVDKLLEPNGLITYLVFPLAGIIMLFVAVKLVISSIRDKKEQPLATQNDNNQEVIENLQEPINNENKDINKDSEDNEEN